MYKYIYMPGKKIPSRKWKIPSLANGVLIGLRGPQFAIKKNSKKKSPVRYKKIPSLANGVLIGLRGRLDHTTLGSGKSHTSVRRRIHVT